MNSRGDVIMAEKEEPHDLHLITMSHGDMAEKWCRHLPGDINPLCRKAVTGSGDVLLQNSLSSPDTVTLRADGSITTSRQEGSLITTCLHDLPVYALEKEDDDWEIVVMDHREERRLRPPPAHRWGNGIVLSVCGSGERVAVTDSLSRTLSIFRGQKRK